MYFQQPQDSSASGTTGWPSRTKYVRGGRLFTSTLRGSWMSGYSAPAGTTDRAVGPYMTAFAPPFSSLTIPFCRSSVAPGQGTKSPSIPACCIRTLNRDGSWYIE